MSPGEAPAAVPADGARVDGLHVTGLAVAVRHGVGHKHATELLTDDHQARIARAVGVPTHIPLDRLLVRQDYSDGVGVAEEALGALGDPGADEPLYLMRSGPLPDPFVAVLARLVQRLGWRGQDTGFTHLDEAGGTAIFDLLSWSSGPGGAAAVIVDEPIFSDSRDGIAPAVAVAIRVRRGASLLRLLDCGDGCPVTAGTVTAGTVTAGTVTDETVTDETLRDETLRDETVPGDAMPGDPVPGDPVLDDPALDQAAQHVFAGRGPCDGWLELHRAAAAGRLAAGDRVLILASGGVRSGWARFEVTGAAELHRAATRATTPVPVPVPVP